MESTMKSAFQTYNRLKLAGFTEEQASAIAESVEDSAGHLATKEDIADMATKADIKDMATKADIEKLEAATKADIGKIERDLSWLSRLYMGSTLIILMGLALNYLHH